MLIYHSNLLCSEKSTRRKEKLKMKKGIHPEYHEITYVMTDGTEKKVHSTWGKAGDKMTLEIDPKSHPAWTGVHRMVDSGGQVGKFNSKFAKFGLKAAN